MDVFTLLRQQQLDFCRRLEVGKSLLDEEHYFSKELVILEQNVIEKVTLESIQEAEDIIHQYQFDYPRQQILNTVFYGKLVEYSFSSRYGHLFSFIPNNPEYINFDSYTVTQHHLYFKNNHDIRILLKACHGDFNNSVLTLSTQEFNEHDVFVFSLCPHDLTQNMHTFPLLLLGFITKDLIKKNVYYNNNLKFNLEIQDLLYIGGFIDYFTVSPDSNAVSFEVISNNNKLSPVNIPLKKGEYNQVVEILNTEQDDSLPPHKLLFLKGICYYRLGQKRKAIDCFLQVINLNSDSYFSYHWLGQIYQDMEEYERALNCYNTEIKLNSINFFAYFNRALVHNKLDNFVQALDDYNVAVKINQSFFQTFYNRGIICYKLGDYYGAIDNYLQALKINPDLPNAHYNLAIIYQQLNNYKQAIASYQQAIELKKNYINAYYNLAILQANIGLYKQSIETYETILTIDPSFIPAIYNHKSLVLLLKKEGNIILSENDSSSHIAHAVADIINVSRENNTTYSSEEKSNDNFSIMNNHRSFDFLAID